MSDYFEDTDTVCDNYIECPYCGHKQDEDYMGMEAETTCDKCEKEFTFHYTTTLCFHAKQKEVTP